jgi:aminomethyltransferase
MTVVDVRGADAKPFVERLLANNVDKLSTHGKALYSCMLNERAGVVDDLVVYYLADPNYRMVVNAATRAKDLAWLQLQARQFRVQLQEREDLAMIAVQGPNARNKVIGLLPAQEHRLVEALSPFTGVELKHLFVARTGYTGEDGFEIMLPNENAGEFWSSLVEAGVQPAGLGARDSLRLEAGMNLYGTDMDEDITPLECGLSWTVAWKPLQREFIGRRALEAQYAEGPKRIQVGLVLERKGVIRGRQRVFVDDGSEGEVTSGTFSPTLAIGIGLARVPASIGAHCEVEIRSKRVPAKVVKPPFVRHGKACWKHLLSKP